MDRIEAGRRATHTNQVTVYFQAHPGQWIDAAVLMPLGGTLAWRTRVSDSRKYFAKVGLGTIENWLERDVTDEGAVIVTSRYRFVPHQRPATKADRLAQQAALFY